MTAQVDADYPNHRRATAEEEQDWLNGYIAIDGAVETEAGLLVPDDMRPEEAAYQGPRIFSRPDYVPGRAWR